MIDFIIGFMVIAGASFKLRGKDRPDARPEKGASKARTGSDKNVSVTVSIGLAEAQTSNNTIPEDVLKEADKALYKAKKTGRNRVI